MNHDVCLKVINADEERGKGDNKEGERGDVYADKVVGKLAFEKNNKISHSIHSRHNRRLNMELCKINLLLEKYLHSV